MPITRTTMIDDDGSGTTGTIINNAWKQQFYDQIDALGVGLPIVYGTWTPADASGAGLALTNQAALYAKVGRLVFVTAYVTYPTTASGANAQIGGFPFPFSNWAGAYQIYGPNAVMFYNAPGSTAMLLMKTTAGTTPWTNVQMTGAVVLFSGVYLTP